MLKSCECVFEVDLEEEVNPMNVETEKITVTMGKKTHPVQQEPDPREEYFKEYREKSDMKLRHERVYLIAFRCAYLKPIGSMRDLSREMSDEYVSRCSA